MMVEFRRSSAGHAGQPSHHGHAGHPGHHQAIGAVAQVNGLDIGYGNGVSGIAEGKAIGSFTQVDTGADLAVGQHDKVIGFAATQPRFAVANYADASALAHKPP